MSHRKMGESSVSKPLDAIKYMAKIIYFQRTSFIQDAVIHVPLAENWVGGFMGLQDYFEYPKDVALFWGRNASRKSGFTWSNRQFLTLEIGEAGQDQQSFARSWYASLLARRHGHRRDRCRQVIIFFAAKPEIRRVAKNWEYNVFRYGLRPIAVRHWKWRLWRWEEWFKGWSDQMILSSRVRSTLAAGMGWTASPWKKCK